MDDSRRKNPRTETNGHVVAQIVDAKDEALIGTTFHSEIMEISPCGMRLKSDLMIEGGRLDLWAEVSDHPVKMFLSTEVRWSSTNISGGYQMGVEIAENPLSDIVEWCEFQRKAWFQHKADQAQS